jgi:hypothetical protein
MQLDTRTAGMTVGRRAAAFALVAALSTAFALALA